MRDLRTEELGHVYGAGGRSSCAPKQSKCKGGSGSGKGSGSRGKGSRGKGGKSKGRGRC